MPDNTAWLIDGVLTKSELARRAQYTATGGAEGVAGIGDLKVIPLAVPGNGVRVSVGGAQILNRYVTPVNQAYVVSNPTIDTIDSSKMPPSNPGARSHLVVATVGDPQYSATGHPWMLATDPPDGDENTFQYVRTWVIPNVPAGTKRFSELGLNYPALELARLDIPGGSTTYTTGTIVDLRKLVQPRTKDYQWHVYSADADSLGGAALTYEVWPDNSVKQIDIPSWATMCYANAFINGVIDGNTARTQARIRISASTASPALATPYTQYDASAPAAPFRTNILLGGTMAIPSALRGTTQQFELTGTAVDAPSLNGLATDSKSSVMIQLRFVEEPD